MAKDKKLYEVRQWASLFLQKHNCEPLVADILLQHHLNVSRTQFFMMLHEIVPEETMQTFQRDITEHVETGIPVQHLTGYEYFYGRRFSVNKHVLIPRPETEELVQHVIKIVKQNAWHRPTIVDVGTGSGVIAITLAKELEEATIYATDISEQALHVAKKNAQLLEADISFLQGNFLEPVEQARMKAHLIVSNPPYIAYEEKDQLSRTVKNFDPHSALFAEENGLAAYKEIVKNSSAVLHQEGVLCFEIGHRQGDAVQAIIQHAYPKSDVKIFDDINGKQRIVCAYVKKEQSH